MREIRLLGTVQVKGAEEELPRFRSQRAMALLGYLTVDRRPLTRTHLAQMFWPDDAPESGKTKLRRELYNLVQILPDCWQADRVKVHFVPTTDTVVDLDAMRQLEQDESWQAAADLLHGEFLEGIALEDSFKFETWLLGERERWRQRAAHILTHAIDELESQGAYRRALRHGQSLLQLMPWREETQRQVMRLLALSEQRSAALKQFETCKQVLWDELGVAPSAETLALYERIKRTPHFSRDNIPAVTTPLIGRERELETLSSLLADPDVRLVTITGLGGMGKTRLALDVAWRRTAGQFRDGVAFVQLVALESADHLIPAVARALHLPLAAADKNPARQQLLDFLKSRQTLLVLDNCEHLLQDMELVADILQSAPKIQILATSRARLRLLAEYVFPLQGLTYDDQPNHPAALLFKGTAQRIRPDFDITELNTSFVNALCRMVDGMPLALELAASWLDTTPVADVVAEIEENLDFLAADLHDLPVRHRSLRGVLESTWSGLQPQTQQVFAALSAFRGSFSPDAAREVAKASPNLLTRLVAHSILQFDREEDRYQLHEMLRQFAAERLTDNPEQKQVVHQRHYAYYLDLAQRGGAAMRGGDQVGWIARLELDESNIRQAFDRAVINDIESAASFPIALHLFWHNAGRSQEGLRQCEQVLPYRDHLTPGIQPWLLAIYADMTWPQGRAQESAALRLQAKQLFKEQGDRSGMAFSSLQLTAVAKYLEGDIERSKQLAREGLEYAQTEKADSFYTSFLLQSLGADLRDTGFFDEAEEHFRQGYQLCLDRHDQMTGNYFLAAMTGLAFRREQQLETQDLAEQCLGVSRQLGMIPTELMALHYLGLTAFTEDNLDLAEEYLTDGIALASEANYLSHLATIRITLGDVFIAKGSTFDALKCVREAAEFFEKTNEEEGVAECIERLAQWLWKSDKHSLEQVGWFACASSLLDQSGLKRLPLDEVKNTRTKANMESSLGKEAFSKAWAKGEEMSLDEALDELLQALPQETKWQDKKDAVTKGRLQ